MAKKKLKEEPLNKGHYFEVVDRLHVILSNLEDFIYIHPAVARDAKAAKKVDKAMELLADVYQIIGSKIE